MVDKYDNANKLHEFQIYLTGEFKNYHKLIWLYDIFWDNKLFLISRNQIDYRDNKSGQARTRRNIVIWKFWNFFLTVNSQTHTLKEYTA